MIATTIFASTVSATNLSAAVVSAAVSPAIVVTKPVSVSPVAHGMVRNGMVTNGMVTNGMVTNGMVANGAVRRLTVNQMLSRAMHNPDEWVIRLRYVGKDGVTTERVVSPIKMVGPTSLLALCLCREEPRRFELGRCSHIELLDANDVLMPVAIRIIPPVAVAPVTTAPLTTAPLTTAPVTSVKVPVAVPSAMALTAELAAV
jgi:hypothetical protein